MAEKDKIPQIAIERIIQLRNDKYHNYGFKDIAEILAKELDIHVTAQAVGYQYKKNKDLILPSEPTSLHSAASKIALTPDSNGQSEKVIKSIVDRQKIIKKNSTSKKEFDTTFTDNLSNEDLESLLKGD